MPPSAAELWQFLPWGYLLTIAFEIPVLLFGLSPRHTIWQKLWAGFWLTACTYPIVVVLLPLTVWARWGEVTYLIIAETFAPIAECLLFLAAFGLRPATEIELADGDVRTRTWQSIFRDCGAIIAANLCSFIVGGYLLEALLQK